MIIAGVRLNSEEKILMDSSLNSEYHWCLQNAEILMVYDPSPVPILYVDRQFQN